MMGIVTCSNWWGIPGRRNFRKDGSNLTVIDNSNKNHYRTASEGFSDRLKNVKLP
jgi:hypothetical protein